MIKRQDSQLLSSSHRQTPPPSEKQKHAKTVGCMSGIFKLFSKYQNPKKLLTFGKKGEKKALGVNKNVVTRCPMLSPKVRRPNALEKLEEAARKPRKEMDGLMAAKEEDCWPGNACNWEEEEEEEESSSESKRQKLLEALEKCNEDLEALKMIIKAVKRPLEEAAPPRMVDCGDRAPEKMCIKKCEDEKIEKVKSELWNNLSYGHNFKCHNNERHTRSQSKTRPERHDRISARSYSKFVKEPNGVREKPISNAAWASSAMVRSVEEVCNDITWGEKREVADMGVMLHNHICKDLIEETIHELGYHKMYRFPLHGCKRRLSF